MVVSSDRFSRNGAASGLALDLALRSASSVNRISRRVVSRLTFAPASSASSGS